MKNKGSIPISTKFVGVYQINIHRKYEANLCIGLSEDVKNVILHSDI